MTHVTCVTCVTCNFFNFFLLNFTSLAFFNLFFFFQFPHFSAHQPISSISVSAASAASAYLQHQCISSISASAVLAHQQHQRISYMHRMGYLPIYINSGHISLYTLTPPDMLQTPPDMLQTPPDMHQTPPDIMLWFWKYYIYWHQCLKLIYIDINAHVTDTGQTTTTSDDRATLLLICASLSFAKKLIFYGNQKIRWNFCLRECRHTPAEVIWVKNCSCNGPQPICVQASTSFSLFSKIQTYLKGRHQLTYLL